MLKDIVGVYFDLFGTLIDSYHTLTIIWSRIAKRLGTDITPEDPRIWEGILRQIKEAKRLTKPWVVLSSKEMHKLNINVLDAMGVDRKASKVIIAGEFEREFRNGTTFRLNPGCKKTLEKIYNLNMKTGVLTNASSMLCKARMDELGIIEFFDLFIHADEVGYNKSHIEIYEIALEAMSTKYPEKVLHIGDDPLMDALMAQKVGMTPILLDPYNLHSLDNVIKIRKLPELLLYLQ